MTGTLSVQPRSLAEGQRWIPPFAVLLPAGTGQLVRDLRIEKSLNAVVLRGISQKLCGPAHIHLFTDHDAGRELQHGTTLFYDIIFFVEQQWS